MLMNNNGPISILMVDTFLISMNDFAANKWRFIYVRRRFFAIIDVEIHCYVVSVSEKDHVGQEFCLISVLEWMDIVDHSRQ